MEHPRPPKAVVMDFFHRLSETTMKVPNRNQDGDVINERNVNAPVRRPLPVANIPPQRHFAGGDAPANQGDLDASSRRPLPSTSSANPFLQRRPAGRDDPANHDELTAPPQRNQDAAGPQQMTLRCRAIDKPGFHEIKGMIQEVIGGKQVFLKNHTTFVTAQRRCCSSRRSCSWTIKITKV